MRKGFTIIELLVASVLLGILVTILTMVFNQSSIAWRTGVAGTLDMNTIRENIAEVREEADNAFIHKGTLYRITGLWDRNGNLRNRACDAPGSTDENDNHAGYLRNKLGSGLTNFKADDMKSFSIQGGSGSSGSSNKGQNQTGNGSKNYTVNVMSAGPDREFDTYDDVWSWPDDFE